MSDFKDIINKVPGDKLELPKSIEWTEGPELPVEEPLAEENSEELPALPDDLMLM